MSPQLQNPSLLDESSTCLLNSFTAKLENLAQENEADIVLNLKNKYAGEKNASEIRLYVEVWNDVKNKVSILLNAEDKIFYVSNWKDSTKTIIKYSDSLKNDVFLNAEAQLKSLMALDWALINLIFKLPKEAEERGTNHHSTGKITNHFL